MKKVYTLLILGFFAIGLVISLANYLSSGKIVVTTNDKDNTITLQGLNQGAQYTKNGLGSLSATVAHGQYAITVKNGSKVSLQLVSLKRGHETFRYSISLSDLKTVEPVTFQNVQDVMASSNQLQYLDTDSGYLSKVDSQNKISPLNTTQPLQKIKWASASFGVGQDSNGHLYTVEGATIKPLGVPFAYQGAIVNFAVSSNKQIYVSYGSFVYSGQKDKDFKKIYTTTSSTPVLSTAGSQIVIADENEEEGGASQPLLITLSSAGQVTKKEVEGEVKRISPSPSGKYFVSTNESYAVAYDATLRQIVTVPASSTVGYVSWLNGEKFFYTSKDELWMYDLTNRRADLVATMPFHVNAVTGLAVSDDASYVYITASLGSDTSSAVFRVGLKGQRVADNLAKLGNVLPLALTNSSIGMINFKGTAVVLVKPVPGSPSNAQANLQEAQSTLTQYGFDAGKLNLVAGN